MRRDVGDCDDCGRGRGAWWSEGRDVGRSVSVARGRLLAQGAAMGRGAQCEIDRGPRGRPALPALLSEALDIAQAKDRIPVGSFIGGQVYNFWQDADHVRGIWRRATPESYATGNPQWETVLDLDALAASEKANWVWKGAAMCPAGRATLPDQPFRRRRGCSDHPRVRPADQSFVKDGFAAQGQAAGRLGK